MSARKIYEVVADDANIELWGREGGDPELYVEGVHGFQVVGPNVKMNLYTVAPDSTPQLQRREVVTRLVMPLAQFLQLADFVGEQVEAIQQALPRANPGSAPAGQGEPGP